ncbi:hypothetical protein SDC9_80444 [bioreactor metagenome]|uniref:Secretion system C-terminal sorting domain-containing protein n=1 Tax=bioreactor metagenome TaxID=1076179 RepID=A0A644Z564_9ZZZZ
MKRNILLICLFSVLTLSSAYAQNLSLSYESSVLTPNETIYIWGDSGYYNTIYSHFKVTNNSSSAMDVLVRKTEISLQAGSENSFCWGTCYIPSVYVSPTAVNIGAGVSDSLSFSGDYKPQGVAGASTIMYTFFDKYNTNDSIAVIVVYNAGTASISDRPASVEFSNAFPNPASSFVNFNYELQGTSEADFVITDLLGSEIFSTKLQNEKNKLSVDVTNFNAGVYFYSLRVDGKLYFTRKLIVRH